MKYPIRWFLGASCILSVGVGTAIALRMMYWPCGRWETESGCVASVRLQTQALGFEEDTVQVNFRSFDLSTGADTVLVGLGGVRQDSSGQNRYYAVLALFDARNGTLIREIRAIKGNVRAVWQDGDDTGARTVEIALSPDGQLAASYGMGEGENRLLVQQTSDGQIVKEFPRGDPDDENLVNNCISQLDFTADSRSLQCGSVLYDLDNRNYTSLSDSNGNYKFPRAADFHGGRYALAPDGTRFDRDGIVQPSGAQFPLESDLKVLDDVGNLAFSPNSQLVLEVRSNRYSARGFRRLIPSPFRRLSGIAVWNREAELQHLFFANQRYDEVAWSRDSEFFALLSQNLTLQTFRAPSLKEE
ncbi:hypothetical protein PN498_17905 [Oscillatoria sp. CS-180]|uniref:hypothetical protein n=1 Tax=Oscillatoria sp. CS-180 TaxID=3021720 RepID=UPI00232F7CE9|nr:hypothetical protein [Oscillatoria sp. CS-180]MDB9527875.1 hypothetical protein [Oscillatoria sp. CS-180]